MVRIRDLMSMDAPLTCRRCGHVNASGGNFCSSCGSPLSDLTDEPTEMLKVDEIQASGATTVVGFVVSRLMRKLPFSIPPIPKRG